MGEGKMNDIRKLLPIGSVVLLKNGKKKLMIYGVMQSDENGKPYDYLGVLYPEGYIGSKAQFLFQHEDVDEVCFLGCEDEEREGFIERLDKFYRKKN